MSDKLLNVRKGMRQFSKELLRILSFKRYYGENYAKQLGNEWYWNQPRNIFLMKCAKLR